MINAWDGKFFVKTVNGSNSWQTIVAGLVIFALQVSYMTVTHYYIWLKLTLSYFFDGYMILILALPECKPYLEEACEAAAKKLGRTLKIGTWNGISGCYYYKTGKYTENVYFSQSGSTSEKKKTPALKNQFRPKGYDCKTGSFL